MASGWRKSPEWLVSIFGVGFPADPRARLRSMFGYPAGFVNGNMFSGLFQDSLFVRLPESEREQLLAIEGATPFEPMAGRPMREYVVLPMEMLEDAEATRGWIRRAFNYSAGLPAKSKGTGRRRATRQAPGKTTGKTAASGAAGRAGRETVSTAAGAGRAQGSRGSAGRRVARRTRRS